ncbi:MAG: (d)CMP kinase [Chloroflexi bacterium]|jgi:cytidylate kinase|nr:(d)CMP kinase [Chloroflexota bacterium]
MNSSTIAIDGPAASGKSTIGYHLAKELAYLYLDTGVLYRAVTWAALNRHIPIEDEEAVTALASKLKIEVKSPQIEDGRQYTVQIAEQDITWAIRSPEVNDAVSPVSVYPGVREALTQRMREIAAKGQVVMVGRDIGTVVLPDADLKLYIVASVEERAHRRHLEMKARGSASTYDEVLANLQQRDRIDSNRSAAPLKAAEDAVIIDTTTLTIDNMLQTVDQLVETVVA